MEIAKVLAVALVSELDRATAWYEQLLGRPPDARPMGTLADWHLADGGWLQVFLDPARAGATAVNLAVEDFEQARETLRQRGFDTATATTTPTGVELLSLIDPDGNVVTVIGNVATA